MDRKGIIMLCKELGCCDACCLRYIGLKSPKHYENPANTVLKYEDSSNGDSTPNTCSNTSENSTTKEKADQNVKPDTLNEDSHNSNNEKTEEQNSIKDSKSDSKNDSDNSSDTTSCQKESDTSQSVATENGTSEGPPAKRSKTSVCASCLGLLQEFHWQETFDMVREVLEKKGYDCGSYACGLSSPMALIVREKALVLRIAEQFPDYDESTLTALKESWKWSFATKMASHIGKSLDSGAVSPLLVTLNYDYPDDAQELEILRKLSPQLFESRGQQRRRYTTEFTRRSVEQALEGASLAALRQAGALTAARAHAQCVSVVCTHTPIYLAGRYIKLSRTLPQSPWVLEGRRVLPSSVQEIIFQPVAQAYKFSSEQAEQRLKFVAAGREDVDVRCLGDGRPFAIEITDPRRQLTPEELTRACEEISKSGDVIVKSMVPITRDDLTQLKKGEESKSKTYEALCIKLTHSDYDKCKDDPVRVTEEDVRRINEYRNTPELDEWKIRLSQKTPIRVLHRRPLLTRTRGILALAACPVPEHPQLFLVEVQTTAGTYVKEWACGELGRTVPALGAAAACRVGLVALDVSAVHLQWPPVH